MYVIALLLIILMIALLWVARKSIFGWMKEPDATSSPGFTLSDLRQLHKSGAMTDEEFERAKAQIVQSMQSATAPKAADDKNRDRRTPDSLPPL